MNTQITAAPTASAKSSLPSSPGQAFALGLQQMRPQLAAALPSHINVEKFERVVLTAVNMNSELLGCDRRSLFNACNKAAADGLLPDGREGAIVVFKGQAVWMPMVWGLVKKIRQSGELSTISAHIVYQNDQFNYVLGDDERIEHKPLIDGDRGKPRLVYAIAKLKDGGIQREVLTVADVEKARKVSRAPNSPMWSTWWTEGARKTALRRLCKFLPLSAEDRRTLERDETEFQAQKRDALLQQAAAQISAPAPAITHEASEDVEVVEVPQGDVIDTDTGEVIDSGSTADRAAHVALRDKLTAELGAMDTEQDLDGYAGAVEGDVAGLPSDLAQSFNDAVELRRGKLKKGKPR